MKLRDALHELLSRLEPGTRLVRLRRMGADEADGDEGTAKGIGYGVSMLADVETAEGERKRVVFRTNKSDRFGHDRRADRAANALLAFDTTAGFPSHAGVIDVGAIDDEGRLASLADAGEFYFLTEYLPGAPYAEDLRRIGREGRLTELDRARCRALAGYLVKVHAEKIEDAAGYRRAIRDLLGAGEGLFGLADSFDADAPGAPLERLRKIEALAVDWRWRLRGRESRLRRTHGDFHPFNILFDEGEEPLLLDASRGCRGDAADDVICLSVNYLFFALEHREAGKAFLELWKSFWGAYLAATGDRELLEAAPPYLAWRILVLVNPLWYPKVEAEARRTLLDVAKQALENGRFDPVWAEELF
jgi:hypothetical protein